jgi:tetraacyldisaccharide 4'-kinase
MLAPKFWNDNSSILPYLLLPISWLYQIIYKIISFFAPVKKSRIPIICIGNVVAGGSGKTPTAIAIGKIIRKENIKFCYITRGYGRKLKDPQTVKQDLNLANQDPSIYGDEPILLSEIADVLIDNCKSSAINQLNQLNSDISLVMVDDGLQNYSFKKDLSFLVIDGEYLFGNGFTLPSGPLREPIYRAINKSDAIILINGNEYSLAKLAIYNKPILRAKLEQINIGKFENINLLAFCGIGRPEKFFKNLIDNKLSLIESISFPDHYSYKDSDIEKIIVKAQNKNAKIITTKKDWVKLGKYKEQIDFIDVELRFDNEELVRDLIKKIL